MNGAHAEGEVERVITGGMRDVPGATMHEKMDDLQTHDEVRHFANQEPHGFAQVTTNLLLPSCHPSADAGFILMQADGTHTMSGTNAKFVTTVLLETGILPMQEPETRVGLDTAAGLFEAVASLPDSFDKSGIKQVFHRGSARLLLAVLAAILV